MAFISACQSADIGKIFLDSGLVPVVIAVDSNQEIMDEVCKLFSNYFYKNLISGFGIQESFDNAKSSVGLNNKDKFSICCCSHDHDPECVWYNKLFKTNAKHACELHNSNRCSCPDRAKRIHLENCPDLKYY